MHRQRLCRLLLTLLLMSVLSVSTLPAAAQESRRLLFEEIFSGNYSGWERVGTVGEVSVNADNVTITVNSEGQASWAFPALSAPEDIDIEVEARVVNPDSSGNWNLAVLLRATARDLSGVFYHFGVAGNGTWEFSVRPPDAQSYATNIQRGRITDFNASRNIQLRVSARGNTFTFYVNNRLIRQFTDTTLESTPNIEKFFGLMAGTYEGVSNHIVEFRKITVYEVVTQHALLRENFPDNNPNGWGTGRTSNSDVRVENNALVFDVLKENVLSWSESDRRFAADVDVRVDVINDVRNPSDDWSYGVGVRAYKEGDDTYFYLFEVRGTGIFTFTSQRGGSSLNTFIDETPLANFDPTAKHTLRVSAVGTTFTLFVDGVQVGIAQANDLKTQDEYGVLLSAGTFAAATSRARFTNFTVSLPR